MRTKKQPKLILAGAGPGDPDLISLKAIKALQSADVVLYDALVNPEILAHAPAAIQRFVGKRKGHHSFTQDEINELIIDYAFNYGTVVRLKGGDPFIFGRGAEEIAHAEAFGISTEIVPGISSSAAVPAYQGISLTQRHVSESFWVLTGTTKSEQLSADIRLAAQSTATVVILMGMSKLKQIQAVFQSYNKGDTAIAIIQNGTTPREKLGVGTIDTIVDIAHDKKLSSPAIIIIGDVVRHSHKLAHFYEELAVEKL